MGGTLSTTGDHSSPISLCNVIPVTYEEIRLLPGLATHPVWSTCPPRCPSLPSASSAPGHIARRQHLSCFEHPDTHVCLRCRCLVPQASSDRPTGLCSISPSCAICAIVQGCCCLCLRDGPGSLAWCVSGVRQRISTRSRVAVRQTVESSRKTEVLRGTEDPRVPEAGRSREAARVSGARWPRVAVLHPEVVGRATAEVWTAPTLPATARQSVRSGAPARRMDRPPVRGTRNRTSSRALSAIGRQTALVLPAITATAHPEPMPDLASRSRPVVWGSLPAR